MTGIHNLPDEVLLRVFTRGCEYDNLSKDADNMTSLRQSNPRRLKRFAFLVRAVCPRWLHLIDDPSQHNNRFWIAYIVLELASPLGGWVEARRVADFRWQLEHSRGCDLDIVLVDCYDGDDTSHRDISDLTPDGAMRLRLFLHGVRFLLPFQGQIVALTMSWAQPQAEKLFIEFLGGMTHLNRLVRLSIQFPLVKPGRDIKSLRSSDTIADHHSLRSTLASTKSLQDPYLGLSHLWCLDELTLHSERLIWLHDLQLPFNISTLCLRSSWDTKPLFKALKLNPSLCRRLISLTLHGPIQTTGYTKDTTQTTAPITSGSKITFSSLRSLQLQGQGAWIDSVLDKIYFPLIEDVKLLPSGNPTCWTSPPPHFQVSRIPRVRSLPTFGTPSPPPNQFSCRQAPVSRLRSLYIDFPLSWSSLSVLRKLVPEQIGRLCVDTTCQENWSMGEQFAEQLAAILSNLRPRDLEFIFPPSVEVMFFTFGLLEDWECVQTLSMSVHSNIKGGEIIPVCPFTRCIAPTMTELTIDADNAHWAMTSLSLLEADSLTSLRLRIGTRKGRAQGVNANLPEGWEVKPCQTVVRLHCALGENFEHDVSELNGSVFGFLWNTLPNIQELEFKGPSMVWTLDHKQNITADTLMKIARSLHPRKGFFPLPRLNSLTGELDMPKYGWSESLAMKRDRRVILEQLCTARSAVGRPTLGIESCDFEFAFNLFRFRVYTGNL